MSRPHLAFLQNIHAIMWRSSHPVTVRAPFIAAGIQSIQKVVRLRNGDLFSEAIPTV